MARLGPPEKVYVCSFPGNEALGAQNGVFWERAKKFRLKKFMCFFFPLITLGG